MELRCDHCGVIYDDADKNTFCPHDLIMPAADLAQKKTGLALIGHAVRFAHQPDGPTHEIQAIGWNGMVTLADMAGEFAPHLFIVVPQGSRHVPRRGAMSDLATGRGAK